MEFTSNSINFIGASTDDYPDRLLLLITDAGKPMIKLGKDMKKKHGFEKMIHELCLAHATHNVADAIRKHYTKVRKYNFA